MTEETLSQLIESTYKQLPNKLMFQEGTKWSAMVESNTWRKKGVDEEIIADHKTINCVYEMIDGDWEIVTINDIPIEECII